MREWTFDQVRQSLDLDDTYEPWRAQWWRSADTCPTEGLWVGNPAAVRTACQAVDMDSDIVEAFAEAARGLSRSPAIQRLLWHCYHSVFMAPPLWPNNHTPLLELPASTGDAGRMFYAMMYLLALPRLEAYHHSLRIPDAVTRATVNDLCLWMRAYRDKHGVFGLSALPWPQSYFSGKLFALGRLQFEFRPMEPPFHVVRHRQTDEVKILAGDQHRFRDDGQFADADRTTPPVSRTFTSRLSFRERSLIGHEVDDHGAVKQQPVELDWSHWACVLGPDDPVLAVHIPASGRMTAEACDESFAWAKRFFPRYFPDYDFAAFTCVSWFLDPQLAEHLPEKSNIVKFQRRFRLVPFQGANDEQTMERVFGDQRPAKQPPAHYTSLQRVVAQHAADGGCWREAAGILLRDETPELAEGEAEGEAEGGAEASARVDTGGGVRRGEGRGS